VCNGRRYNQETLAVKFKGYSIADVLDLTIEDALSVLEDVPNVRQKLQTLVDVGLGYVHLGQSATTLSGGEAQRMKLARELSKRQTGRTLYLLDEPTTGLHFDDVRKLLEVLHRLADLGNSVIIIEHNLDVIRNADWIVDLGPEGGEDGGRLVGEGRPAKIAANAGSYTGQFLKRYYASTNGRLTPIDAEEEPVPLGLSEDPSKSDSHPERAKRVEGPASKKAGIPAKPKRAQRNTPAEDDLASTRARTGRTAAKTDSPKQSGPRKKKTGSA
jgi:excinuclease ABC subunit A